MQCFKICYERDSLNSLAYIKLAGSNIRVPIRDWLNATFTVVLRKTIRVQMTTDMVYRS